MPDEVRVTTSGDVFDDHCESHALLSPGGSIFDGIVEEMTRGIDQVQADSGHVFLVFNDEASQAGTVVVMTKGGSQEVSTLSELLDALSYLGPSGRPEQAGKCCLLG
jgi:hypothetical protein